MATKKQLVLTEMFSPMKKAVEKVAKGQLFSSSESKKNGQALGATENVQPLNDISKDTENAVATYADQLVLTLKEPEWSKMLMAEFTKPYMTNVFKFLEKEEKKGATIFPPKDLIFNAFNMTPFEEIRVVLIGQDPYHDNGQAHGLCFSVPPGQNPPPSLKNIYKELKVEYPDFVIPTHGCLTSWAKQGFAQINAIKSLFKSIITRRKILKDSRLLSVFLLNATLTVEAHKANSHSNIGWQRFTDRVITLISSRSTKGVVFLLWGGFAHKKETLINTTKHCVIKTAHPSPLSYSKFKGSNCFSKTNEKLIELGREPINWTDLKTT